MPEDRNIEYLKTTLDAVVSRLDGHETRLAALTGTKDGSDRAPVSAQYVVAASDAELPNAVPIDGVTLTVSGGVLVASGGGGGGGGAPATASYVTVSAESGLSAERSLAGGAGIALTDGGANSTLTIAVDSTIATLTGTQTLTNKTLTAPVIGNFQNANHNHQDASGGGSLTEQALNLSDNTTANVSNVTHGFAPKSPGDAAKFLNGATTPAFAQVKDSDLSVSDVTTNNASTSAHGFEEKGTNTGVRWRKDDNTWAEVPGRLIKETVLTSGTGLTHTLRSAARLVRLRLLGGGGGGGGVSGASSSSAGAGSGSSGCYVEAWYSVNGGEELTYTVSPGGAGGAAGNNAGSSPSADTSVVLGVGTVLSATAVRGNGGSGMAAGTAVAFAAGGTKPSSVAPTGTGLLAYFMCDGQPGNHGIRLSGTVSAGAPGAPGAFGGGGAGILSNGAGNAAVANSGAGGGGAKDASNTARAGGNGGSGLIVIEEFA